MATPQTTLRFIVLSEVVLLSFNLSLARERRALKAALIAAEPPAATAALMEAEWDALRRVDVPDEPADPLGAADSAWKVHLRFASRGLMYALGQVYARDPSSHHFAIPMAGGGDLYFRLYRQPTHVLRDAVASVIIDGSVDECGRNEGSGFYLPSDRVFRLPAHVFGRESARSNLAGHGFDVVVSNQITEFSEDTGDPCFVAGQPYAVIVTSDLADAVAQRGDAGDLLDSIPREGVSELRARVLLLGRRFGILGEDYRLVYAGIRDRVERQVVRLPIVEREVSAPTALVGASILAVALLVWLSVALRALTQDPSTGEEPWLLGWSALHDSKERGWQRVAERIERILFTALHLVGFFAAPAVCLIAAMSAFGEAKEGPIVAQVVLLSVCVLFLASVLHLYWRLLRGPKRHRA